MPQPGFRRTSNATSDGLAMLLLGAPLLGSGLFTLASLAGDVTGRLLPTCAGETLLLILPLAALPGLMARVATAGLQLRIWMACTLAFLAGQAVINLGLGATPMAWFLYANRCLVPLCALAVVLSPIAPRQAIRLLTLGAVIAACVYAAPETWRLITDEATVNQQLAFGNRVFGNVALVTSALAPVLFAGLWQRIGERHAEQPRPRWWYGLLLAAAGIALAGVVFRRHLPDLLPSWGFLLAAAIGLVALGRWLMPTRPRGTGWYDPALLAGAFMFLTTAIPTGRRSLLVFAGLVLAWWWWDGLRRRRPGLAATLLVAAVVGCCSALLVLPYTELLWHNDRAMMVRAALEAAASQSWYGGGSAATLDLSRTATEAGGYLQAIYHNTGHVHNELLEVVLQAGWCGAVLVAAVAGWLGWRLLTIPDDGLRRPLVVLMIGLGVAGLTDPTLSHPFGACLLGAVAGVMLKAVVPPASEQPTPSKRWRHAWLVLLCAPLLCFILLIAQHRVSAALVPAAHAGEAAIATVIRSSGDPGPVMTFAIQGIDSAQADGAVESGLRTIAAGDATLGAVCWGKARDRFRIDHASDERDKAAACLRGLRDYPFELEFHAALEDLRRRHPGAVGTLPADVERRLELLFSPTPAALDLQSAPSTIGEAADQHAALTGLMARGRTDAAVVDQLDQLVSRYRLFQEMTALVLRGIVLCPSEQAAGIAERFRRKTMQAIDRDALARALTATPIPAERAALLLPLLGNMYPMEMTAARNREAGTGPTSPLIDALAQLAEADRSR